MKTMTNMKAIEVSAGFGVGANDYPIIEFTVYFWGVQTIFLLFDVTSK